MGFGEFRGGIVISDCAACALINTSMCNLNFKITIKEHSNKLGLLYAIQKMRINEKK